METLTYENSLEFARQADEEDSLRHFRDQFLFPEHNGEKTVYFTGNSLGLQPKGAKKAIEIELEDWHKYGVEGHFEARNPWFSYHELLTDNVAYLVGAKKEEVVVTHSLTTNLHLLMVSFYQPKGKRTKILCEKKAFPSDQYALQSQIKFHGLDIRENLVEVGPREGEYLIRHEDIIAKINEFGDELALVMIGGVNYYSGQVFNMKEIAAAGHEVGANVGFDLAHGVGNIPLQLHDWDVDFAAWCSYKYLNSSPGGVSGMYIHKKHATNTDLVRFAGWWGHNKEERFKMEHEFQPIPTAEGWQLSNAPVLGMAVHKVSLEMFQEAGMDKLREKSLRLTGYLEYVLKDISERNPDTPFEVITPKNEDERGCQLSILAHGSGKALFDHLSKNGVIADWREPNVIRIAPVPLYNNFEDVYRFGKILEQGL